jgi:hypothetical protein
MGQPKCIKPIAITPSINEQARVGKKIFDMGKA